MRRSLALRLVLALAATVIAAWAATGVFSYLDARDQIGTMLDDHLVQAASLLLGSRSDREVRPPIHWGEDGHSLIYQGFAADGRLLFRSADAPVTPLSRQVEGFSEVERSGERLRIFGARAPDGAMHVLVGEHANFRNELAASIARHLLHPVAFALPLLALLIVLVVRWALAPLRSLAREVGKREPTNLALLAARQAPVEVEPLTIALDALFARVAASMESERRFTADAAHELRTPLAAIRAHAEVALAASAGSERDRALAHVVAAVSRADRLVGQLLTLARLDARQKRLPTKPVALADLLRGQIAEAAPAAAAKGLNLGLADSDEATAAADPDLLALLVRNLIDNAIRYTPPGGQIDVSVRSTDDRAILRVADTGPGLPPGERERVLERFYRGGRSSRAGGERTREIPAAGGTESSPGSGIGLSIVARIAELHGASIVLGDGLFGRGLSVEVSLPVALSPP